MLEGKAPHLLWQPVARQNGNSVELMCFLGASPQPCIKWYYGNRELKPDSRFQFKFDSIGKDLYLATLQIKDIVDSDAGCYRCVSVNPHGRGQANLNLKLRDSSSPSFVEKPHIFSRDDGRVIAMEFRVKSILNPTFVWRKGDEIVAQSERINIVVREEADQTYYAALEIKEKDAGRFTCTIENDSGKLTAGFTVKFEVPQGAPSFTRKSQIFEVTSDSGDPTMVFDVGYKADRNPEVTWIDPKGEKMKESSRIRFFTTPDGPNNCFTAKLELKNYKAEDSGTYTCNIKNEAGEATAELSLNIQEAAMVESKAPHFLRSPLGRQYDDSVQLECFLNASVRPDIKWYYGDKELKPNSRFQFKFDSIGKDSYLAALQIKDPVDSDAGCYRCVSVNPYGGVQANFNTEIRGFSAPSFVEKPQVVSRCDGQLTVMEFRVKSILRPTFVWYKEGKVVAESDTVSIVLKEEANQIYYAALEIKEPLEEEDAGHFICKAKNDSGELRATFVVKHEVPEGAPNFTRRAKIFQMTSYCGDPAVVFDVGYKADRNPQVMWINPKGEKMKESPRIRFFTIPDGSNNCFTAKLELKNYKIEDSGTYICNIKNEAGEAEVKLTLNIEGPMDDESDDESDA